MVQIAFLGDISFNDEYNALYVQGINPFEKISRELYECDLVVGNLECIASGDEGENRLKKPRLKTNAETLNYLKNINISVVTLAHNHVFDNLTDGFKKTVSFLDADKIRYLGAGFTDEISRKPFLFEKDGMKFCFLSYVHEDTNPNLPDNCPVKLNIYKKEKIIEDIFIYKQKKYIVILLLHWGGKYEGGMYPDYYQSDHAKQFVDSGADLIIGHHSHTFQPFEKRDDKYIFYSLGNFCFSDIISDGKLKRILNNPRFTTSAVVQVNFKSNKYSVKIIPIKNKNRHIHKSNRVINTLILRSRNVLFRLLKKSIFLRKLYRIKYLRINPYLFMLYNFSEISYIKRMGKIIKRN
jgi:hypothetical protein